MPGSTALAGQFRGAAQLAAKRTWAGLIEVLMGQ
jgi:hypothetical protein